MTKSIPKGAGKLKKTSAPAFAKGGSGGMTPGKPVKSQGGAFPVPTPKTPKKGR